MKIFKLLFMFFIIVKSVYGGGLTGADFLNINPSAKYAGSAEAMVAFADDVGALSFNPAAMAYIDKREILFTHIEWFGGAGYEYIGTGQKFLLGGAGIGITFFHQSPFDDIDLSGQIDGKVSAQDFAINAGYAQKIRLLNYDINVGGNIKFIRSKLADYYASSMALDASTILKIKIPKLYKVGGDNLKATLCLQNIGIGAKFGNERFPLPLTLRAGVGYVAYKKEMSELLTGIAYTGYLLDKLHSLNVGAEYGFRDRFFARVGYILTGNLTNKLFLGGTLQREIKNKQFFVHFSFTPNSILGNIYNFTVGVKI